MSEQIYTGKVSGMKASNKWLASEDFIGLGDVQLVIAGVYQDSAEVMQDGKKKDFFSLAFEKTKKRMVINATNRRALAAAFGADTAAWVGRGVKIYVQDGIRNPAGGATVSGLRLRITADPELVRAKRDQMTGGDA